MSIQTMNATDRQFIGLFDIASGQIRIADPCHDANPEFAPVVTARNGKWVAVTFEHFGVRQLLAHHIDILTADIEWNDEVQMGVDTGTFSITDHACSEGGDDLTDIYHEYIQGPYRAALLPFGAVVCNCVGDGWFSVKLMHKGGVVVAVLVGDVGDDELDRPAKGSAK